MSSGEACKGKTSNDIPKPEGYHRHVVVARMCNYSAFNGYRWTPSDYSKIRCVDTGLVWRTKAAYVSKLPDAKGAEQDVTVYR